MSEEKTDLLAGLSFASAGRLSNKTLIDKIIKKHGGNLSSTVTGKVTHLIVNDSLTAGTASSDKYLKAKKNNITIISENEFYALCSKKNITVESSPSKPNSTSDVKQSPYFVSSVLSEAASSLTNTNNNNNNNKNLETQKSTTTTTPNFLNNKHNKDFIVTILGKTTSTKDDLKNLIETSGGKVIENICEQAQFVVCNDKSNTELQLAVELNINIINEMQLIRVCDYHANMATTTANKKNSPKKEVPVLEVKESIIPENKEGDSEERSSKKPKIELSSDIGPEWQCSFYSKEN